MRAGSANWSHLSASRSDHTASRFNSAPLISRAEIDAQTQDIIDDLGNDSDAAAIKQALGQQNSAVDAQTQNIISDLGNDSDAVAIKQALNQQQQQKTKHKRKPLVIRDREKMGSRKKMSRCTTERCSDRQSHCSHSILQHDVVRN